jgi:hypothetical protein
VTLLERSPVLAELLASALSQADKESVGSRMKLVRGDSKNLLEEGECGRFDVVYMDSMYPGAHPMARKSASKKELTILRDLVGDDDDAPILFQTVCALSLFYAPQ